MASSPRIAGHARVRHDGDDLPQRKRGDAPKKDAHDNPALIRWSIQEVRRIAVRLAQRRIAPANIIAWSL